MGRKIKRAIEESHIAHVSYGTEKGGKRAEKDEKKEREKERLIGLGCLRGAFRKKRILELK